MPDYEDDEEGYGNPGEPEPGTCPGCGSRRSKKISFTMWGGVVGPALFKLVKCSECGQQYNRETGKPFGWLPIIVYTVVMLAIFGAVLAAIMG